jgi:hypothetical protein
MTHGNKAHSLSGFLLSFSLTEPSYSFSLSVNTMKAGSALIQCSSVHDTQKQGSLWETLCEPSDSFSLSESSDSFSHSVNTMKAGSALIQCSSVCTSVVRACTLGVYTHAAHQQKPFSRPPYTFHTVARAVIASSAGETMQERAPGGDGVGSAGREEDRV